MKITPLLQQLMQQMPQRPGTMPGGMGANMFSPMQQQNYMPPPQQFFLPGIQNQYMQFLQQRGMFPQPGKSGGMSMSSPKNPPPFNPMFAAAGGSRRQAAPRTQRLATSRFR